MVTIALDRQQIQQLRDRDDLVGLSRHLHGPEHKALTGGEGGDHMDGAFIGLTTGPAHGFPVDRYNAHRHAGPRRHPGDEAALESLRVEGGEGVAGMIVRRGSIAKRPEPTRKIKLPLAKAGDLDKGFGSGEHRQQKYFVKRISDLAALAWIRKIIEIIEKYHGFEESHVVHGHPPLSESRGSS